MVVKRKAVAKKATAKKPAKRKATAKRTTAKKAGAKRKPAKKAGAKRRRVAKKAAGGILTLLGIEETPKRTVKRRMTVRRAAKKSQ